MSDERKALLTPEGVYIQDEDGQGWTLLPGTEEHEYPVQHFTNEEAEKLFKTEMAQAEIRAAEEQLRARIQSCIEGVGEALRALHQLFSNFVAAVTPPLQALWEQLQTINAEAEKHPRKTQRPDYSACPKCCTHAKTKRDRKPRRRER